MTSTKRIDAAAFVVIRRAAKFAGPNHERVVEHAAFLEVLDQRGHRLVHRPDARAVAALEIIVTIPAAGENLHKPYALFHEAAGHQTLPTELSGLLALHAVGFANMVGLALQIDDSGYLRLHAEGQFVAFHAGGEVGVAGMLGGVALVEKREFVQRGTLMFPRLMRRRVQIEDGRSCRAQTRTLKVPGQKAVAPVARTALRQGQLGHHHVAGQILIHRTQAVIHPGAQRRVSTQPAAGVHVKQRLGMIQRLGRASAVVTQFIGHLRQMLPLIAHLQPRLPYLARLKRAAYVELETGLQPARALALRLMQRIELRLGIKRIHLTRPAFHEEHDHVFRLGRVHWFSGRQWTRRFLGEQIGHGQGTQ